MVHTGAQPHVLTISGPSGSGQTTLMLGLIRRVPQVHVMRRIITRQPRPTDHPGEYEYVSVDEFRARRQNNELAWSIEVHGNYYGAALTALDAAFAHHTLSLIVVTVDVVHKVYDHALSRRSLERTRSIFLNISDKDELTRRLVARGEKDVGLRVHQSIEACTMARVSNVPLTFIDAHQARETILEQVLALVT